MESEKSLHELEWEGVNRVSELLAKNKLKEVETQSVEMYLQRLLEVTGSAKTESVLRVGAEDSLPPVWKDFNWKHQYISPWELRQLSEAVKFPGEEYPLLPEEESLSDTYEHLIDAAADFHQSLVHAAYDEAIRETGEEMASGKALREGILAGLLTSSSGVGGLALWSSQFVDDHLGLVVGGSMALMGGIWGGVTYFRGRHLKKRNSSRVDEQIRQALSKLPVRERRFYRTLDDFVSKGERLPEDLDDLDLRQGAEDINPGFIDEFPDVYETLLKTVHMSSEIADRKVHWDSERYRKLEDRIQAYRQIAEDTGV